MARVEKSLLLATAPKVLVSNEVGGGIVPEHPLGRRFRDLQGILNQRVAALADRVVLMVAGLPLIVKGSL
jgi:adenosylcobinamide kinase/adenosylcobinamide-phosphate guanylyltransferase